MNNKAFENMLDYCMVAILLIPMTIILLLAVIGKLGAKYITNPLFKILLEDENYH